jgi:anaerobic ribonucleoside-triphosphate reductase
MGAKGKIDKGQNAGSIPAASKVCAIPCEVFSRIVGYFRPVQDWHNSKKQEFADRHYLKFKDEKETT